MDKRDTCPDIKPLPRVPLFFFPLIKSSDEEAHHKSGLGTW